MTAAASMGWGVQFGAGAASPVTSQFEVLSCGLAKRTTLVQSPGLRGTRSHIKDAVNTGPYTVGGAVVMEPRPDELAFWLPYILGGSASGTTFPLAETLPAFFATVDKVAKVHTYTGCKVARAVFESSPGQNLRMSMEVEGLTEVSPVGAAGSFPAISATLSTLQPYIHQEGVLTLNSNPYNCRSVRITIDNALILDRFLNSITRLTLPESDRIITVEVETPWTADEVALYDPAVAGYAGSFVWTNGGVSLTFTFANLKAPNEGPEVAGRAIEIPYNLRFEAFQSGATKELVVTNDSTP